MADNVKATIERKLRGAFAPSALEILDESELHKGHAGYRAGGETHFRVTIDSDCFDGLSRLARQRLVHDVLADELAGPIHALSLHLQSTKK